MKASGQAEVGTGLYSTDLEGCVTSTACWDGRSWRWLPG